MRFTMDVSLKELVEKHNNLLCPPYPNDLMFLHYILNKIKPTWDEKKIYYNQDTGESIIIPILHVGNQRIVLEQRDEFNAVVMPRHVRKKDGKSYKGPKRIFQFRDGNSLIGYIHHELPRSKRSFLKKEDIRAGLVYRFEIIRVGENSFDCVPLLRTFNKDNLEYNLTHCNYEKSKRAKDSFKTQPIIHV